MQRRDLSKPLAESFFDKDPPKGKAKVDPKEAALEAMGGSGMPSMPPHIRKKATKAKLSKKKAKR